MQLTRARGRPPKAGAQRARICSTRICPGQIAAPLEAAADGRSQERRTDQRPRDDGLRAHCAPSRRQMAVTAPRVSAGQRRPHLRPFSIGSRLAGTLASRVRTNGGVAATTRDSAKPQREPPRLSGTNYRRGIQSRFQPSVLCSDPGSHPRSPATLPPTRLAKQPETVIARSQKVSRAPHWDTSALVFTCNRRQPQDVATDDSMALRRRSWAAIYHLTLAAVGNTHFRRGSTAI
ncbi:hypothetical protein SNOG_10430 [Parastagonospora nodorum SN15]|uniref:Uncharacterized protein n=1 Tax=Phaeosphaeria nodorum (strain SN15 / ATCC MYA-4574 / FGSC 10173) TaxID=321614 RepID=Q0UCT4_PHANO|nr:hypothetical protein SNOG_10430 [Parastagonospora nodorum SN15]EAT81824.1 hypothetical protein SNOG_10430 [Parastagonospora nodorum SN15]